MNSTWKALYPSIKAAVFNLDSVDSLLLRLVDQLAATYQARCLLWAGLETSIASQLRVYATAEVANALKARADFSAYPPTGLGSGTAAEAALDGQRLFYPKQLPLWLKQQMVNPRLVQLETGDLIVPVLANPPVLTGDQAGKVQLSLQFVLQLNRPATAMLGEPSATASGAATPIQGWSPEEVEAVEVLCSQMGLAYSALYWRQRLEQARRQMALIGRASRLLNTNLNPDEMVSRIVAELGQGGEGDRAILLDLRDDPVTILVDWVAPDGPSRSLGQRQIERAFWANVIEMFVQGGASYLELHQADPEADPLQIWLEKIGMASALIFPIFILEDFFGVVALLSSQSAPAYQLDELQTIRQVVDQAAIALTNAQHYQGLWAKPETLRLQHQTTQPQALQDELTQLLSRSALERELEQLSTRAIWAIQPSFSIIFCDIDYFKLVNDTYGHPAGDEVLHSLARELQKQLRRATPAYRYGGEEFVIILTDTPLAQSVEVAERLRRMIRTTPMHTSVGGVRLTASFGVAQQNSAQDQRAWDVLQRAEQALYEAKRQGRDRVETL